MIKLIRKKPLGFFFSNLFEKENKRCSEDQIHWYTMWDWYILILFSKNMSDQKIYIFWYCISNDEVPSTSYHR